MNEASCNMVLLTTAWALTKKLNEQQLVTYIPLTILCFLSKWVILSPISWHVELHTMLTVGIWHITLANHWWKSSIFYYMNTFFILNEKFKMKDLSGFNILIIFSCLALIFYFIFDIWFRYISFCVQYLQS